MNSKYFFLLAFLILAVFFAQASGMPSEVDILKQWNASHNSKNISELSKLYYDTVFYYGRKVDANYCSRSKERALVGKDFKQSIAEGIETIPIGEHFTRLNFTKVVVIKGVTKAYPSYLILRKDDLGFKICVEGDVVTDKVLSKRLKESDSGDAIIGDFNGDGKKEKAWVIRPVISDSDLGECENDCYVTIVFSDSSIPSISAYGIGGSLVNLTDLNGDGCDELGMLRWWFQSCWQPFYIFTNVHYKWLNPISVTTHCDQDRLAVEYNKDTKLVTLNNAYNDESTNWEIKVLSEQIRFPIFW
jgi:hypothetical protein